MTITQGMADGGQSVTLKILERPRQEALCCCPINTGAWLAFSGNPLKRSQQPFKPKASLGPPQSAAQYRNHAAVEQPSLDCDCRIS